MSQTKHFQAQEIPEHITQLKDFKKWRFMGNSFQGAVFLGVLENYLLQNKLDQVQKLIQTTRITNNQNGANMKKILEEAYKLKQGNQILDNIIDALKNKDQHNQFLSSFLTEYIKHKKGHEISDAQLQQDFYQYFNLRLILIKKDQNPTTFDAKSKDCVFLFIEDSKYFVVCQNLSIQQPNCSYCNKQTNEQSIKFKCSHTLICNSCLTNFFNKTRENIMCKEKQCQIYLSWKDFQDIQNKIQQSSRIQQNEKQGRNEKCILCKQNFDIDDLLCPTGCQHKFCQSCIRTTYARPPNPQETKCLVFQCTGKVTYQDFQQFYNKGFQKTNSVIVEKQTQDKRFQQSSSTPGFNSEQDQISECIYCLKTYRLQFMYKPICNHNYCQSCCDKLSSCMQFKCCQRDCQTQIKTEDIQDFYYKQIQKKVFSECANCYTQVRISEALTNDCEHQICFECINKIYQNKAPCKCQKCYFKINSRLIDEYFLQRTMENSKIQQEKIDIEFQTHCSFCFSPFTDYNLQQNLTCPSHLVGTCCIIMPLDCPQCYLPSLQIEKQKLQFQLQTFLQENLEYYPETPIKQKIESSIID